MPMHVPTLTREHIKLGPPNRVQRLTFVVFHHVMLVLSILCSPPCNVDANVEDTDILLNIAGPRLPPTAQKSPAVPLWLILVLW